ncbi:MAG: MBL fold metallo-hydrolase [Eubacteriales bacterium]|nr:MBL fold metallo-hydrolase [Eubacteriales bacterium]
MPNKDTGKVGPMALNFCSFSSGSTGNCYLIKTKKTALLVDAGISLKKIIAGLSQTQTNSEQVTALLLTHEHSDHTRSLGSLTRKNKELSVYTNEKTREVLKDAVESKRWTLFRNGKPFTIGDIEIKAFQVSHDAADPVGYSFYAQGRQVSIVTDTGCINEEIIGEIMDADTLVLEANHDVNMLKIGRYPWFLKQRILGERGHLSNESAARTLVRLLSERKKERNIFLAHLSRENNFPEMAYQTVKNILEDEEYYIGTHVKLDTIIRDEISPVYQV